ncbi:3100_t:CDS:2 [Diversispora eburnea]|uniref:3100_t:CDS:1 n=1 Tax=Diversispora eburnea TaxID=1213867 RepID=A0A9N9G0B7_9GLOM|nr:3100_t:CDS:2 [Diversispora eburnea]
MEEKTSANYFDILTLFTYGFSFVSGKLKIGCFETFKQDEQSEIGANGF